MQTTALAATVQELIAAIADASIARVLLTGDDDYRLTEELRLNRTITIRGLAPNRTTVIAAVAAGVMQVSSGATARLEWLDLAGSDNEPKGAVYNEGNLVLSDCWLRDNVGGAVVNYRGNMTAVRSIFHNNSGERFAGAATVLGGAAFMFLDDCTFSDNRGRNGGALHLLKSPPRDHDSPTVRVSGCRFINNSAEANGGSLFAQSATLVVRRTVFLGNHVSAQAKSLGGAVALNNATASLDDCSFRSNVAAHGGGAIMSTSGRLSISGGELIANAATVGAALLFNADSSPNAPVGGPSGHICVSATRLQTGARPVACLPAAAASIP